MRVLVTTPPAAPVVSLDAAKAHLEIQSGDWDAMIELKLAAAIKHLDGPAGWLGRALGQQTLELRADLFDDCTIDLPFAPVVSVLSLTYLDLNGVEQLLDPSLYEVRDATILPAWQRAWPAFRHTGEGVRVRYVAGYQQLPEPIAAAILLMVGDLFRFRMTATVEGKSAPVPMSATVENLLNPFRLY